MKEYPIAFNGAMVRALNAGTKTQTRRIVKAPWAASATQLVPFGGTGVWWDEGGHFALPPYGKIGNRLWVREELRGDGQPGNRREGIMRYGADGAMVLAGQSDHLWPYKKLVLPAKKMPRWACRTILEVTDIRVERLQDISEGDARAEGVAASCPGHTLINEGHICAFSSLWESIHGPDSWDRNPWVWVVGFKKVEES